MVSTLRFLCLPSDQKHNGDVALCQDLHIVSTTRGVVSQHCTPWLIYSLIAVSPEFLDLVKRSMAVHHRLESFVVTPMASESVLGLFRGDGDGS